MLSNCDDDIVERRRKPEVVRMFSSSSSSNSLIHNHSNHHHFHYSHKSLDIAPLESDRTNSQMSHPFIMRSIRKLMSNSFFTSFSLSASNFSMSSSFVLFRNSLFFILILLNYCCTLSEQSLESFSLDKLLEYNSLASCIGKIHVEFTECNTKGAEKAKSYMTNVEMGSEWSKRIKCCGAWRLRDCWMKSANEKCNKEQADQIYKLPFLFMPGLDEDCRDYMPESGKCSVPIWLMIGGISTVVFIVVTCCCCVVYCIRRRSSRGRRQKLPSSSTSSRRSGSGGVNGGVNGGTRRNHKHHHSGSGGGGGSHLQLIGGKPCNGGVNSNSLCFPDGGTNLNKAAPKKMDVVYMNGNSKSIRQPSPVTDSTSEECRKLNNGGGGGCGSTTTTNTTGSLVDPTTLSSTTPSISITIPTPSPTPVFASKRSDDELPV